MFSEKACKDLHFSNGSFDLHGHTAYDQQSVCALCSVQDPVYFRVEKWWDDYV